MCIINPDAIPSTFVCYFRYFKKSPYQKSLKTRFPLRDNLDNEIAFKVINARAVEILFYILQASYDDS